MPPETKPEKEYSPLNVLEVCKNAFTRAYLEHLNNHNHFVRIEGDVELIYLHRWQELYDIILGRPHLESTAEGIAFWVARINTSWKYDKLYAYLVALETDSKQLYIKEQEDDEPRPFGIEASQSVMAYINDSTPQPV
jgi:hypothetical protein